MKNLKSILKKATLILLASFLLAGSPNLLAMDHSDGDANALFSIDEGYAADVSDNEEDDFYTIQTKDDLSIKLHLNENNKFELVEEVDGVEVVSKGKTVCVRYDFFMEVVKPSLSIRIFSLKILRWDGCRFVSSEQYNSVVYGCNISEDGKMVFVKFRNDSFLILRWDEEKNQFVEIYDEELVVGYKVSQDGKVVCVRELGDSLKILGWNEEQNKFIEHLGYHNVKSYCFLQGVKTVCVLFANDSLKKLQWVGSGFVELEQYDDVDVFRVSSKEDDSGKLIIYYKQESDSKSEDDSDIVHVLDADTWTGQPFVSKSVANKCKFLAGTIVVIGLAFLVPRIVKI